jgi:hypothetical protein
MEKIMGRFAATAPGIGQGWPSGVSLSPSDFGAMLNASDILNEGSPYGRVLWVDGNQGQSAALGLSRSAPFLTMQAAFNALQSGDTIIFRGNIREQLVAPVGVFDVTIIGAGNRPRHADLHTVNGGYSTATWKAPASPTALTPLLKVMQQGWRLQNILFAGPTDAASVLLFRDGGAASAERDASHFESWGCRFASGQDGIEQSGGCYNVGLFGNSFHDLTGTALKNTTGAGIAAPYRWQIKSNRFQGCVNWMGAWSAHQFEITDNVIGEITTAYLNTSGGAGHNVILRNIFDIAAVDFDPVGGLTGHATDVWSNYLKDAIETGLPAN